MCVWDFYDWFLTSQSDAVRCNIALPKSNHSRDLRLTSDVILVVFRSVALCCIPRLSSCSSPPWWRSQRQNPCLSSATGFDPVANELLSFSFCPSSRSATGLYDVLPDTWQIRWQGPFDSPSYYLAAELVPPTNIRSTTNCRKSHAKTQVSRNGSASKLSERRKSFCMGSFDDQ